MKTNSLIVIGTIIAIVISVSALIMIDYIEFVSSTTSDKALLEVLDHCARQKAGLNVEEPYLSYSNGTNSIDNIDCKWVTPPHGPITIPFEVFEEKK